MKKGNTNSNVFTILQNERKKSNLITSLSRDDGNQVYDHKSLCDVVVSYFNNLFQFENNCSDFLLVINKIPSCVFHYDNESLLTPFTINEFKDTLFQMDSD